MWQFLSGVQELSLSCLLFCLSLCCNCHPCSVVDDSGIELYLAGKELAILFIILIVKMYMVSCAMTAVISFLPGPKVIKLFSSSTQLSMKFKLLIINKMTKFG